MAKDINKLNEIKVLDGILQVMLDEHLDITEHSKNRENYSTYQSIFEKVKNNYGNEVTNNELAFRKLWYTLKGSNYIENVREDHLKTYKITGDGITFITIGGYEKRYENENWQSKANKSTIANVIASFVIGFTAICISVFKPSDNNDKLFNCILNDSEEMKTQIIDQNKEINFLKMQMDSLSQVQLQQPDSTKNVAIRDLKSQIQ